MEESEDSTGFGFLAGIVILLVVLLVLGFFYFRMEEIRKSDEAIKQCRLSVDLSSLAHVKGVDVYDQLECHPNYVTIDGKDEAYMKRKMANEMADCWYKFGGDTKDLFGKNLVGTDRFCALCSHITFKGDSKNRQIPNFAYYLATENTKVSYGGKTYLQFLTPAVPGPADIESLKTQTMDMIDTSNDYGVVYIYDKEGKVGRLLGSGIGAGGGLAAALIFVPDPIFSKAMAVAVVTTSVVGGALGYTASSDTESEWAAAVMLTPYTTDSFNQLDCEKLPVKQENR